MTRCTLIGLCLIGLFATSADAAVPTEITIQGKVTDSIGNPLSVGAKTFTFRIFNTDAGGAQVWPAVGGEVQSITTGSGGIWVGLVGAIDPLTDAVFADSVRWLEIDVNGAVLPRVRLVTGPYAYRVATVDGASGGTITGKVSIGAQHVNSGDGAFVVGDSNAVLGARSAAVGGSQNSADSAFAIVLGGHNNRASGRYACVAGGRDNQASAEGSFATGYTNHVTGQGSAAFGTDCDVAGSFSLAAGYNCNVTAAYNGFAFGEYAYADHNESFVFNAGSGGFGTTGVGQFNVKATGGVGIQTNAPYTDLTVGGSLGFKNGTDPEQFMFESGSTNADRMIIAHSPSFTDWGLQYQDAGDKFVFLGGADPAMTVDLSSTGGFVGFGSVTSPTNIITLPNSNTTSGRALGFAWDVYSSRRWKDSIETLTDALDLVGKLRGVRYIWKSDASHDIGLIAEEVGQVVPEVVKYEENGIDARSVDYARLVALLIEGMKEQQTMLQEQNERIEGLEEQMRRVAP